MGKLTKLATQAAGWAAYAALTITGVGAAGLAIAVGASRRRDA